MFAVIGADFDNFCMKTFHLWVQKRRPNTRCDCFRPALKDFRPTMLTRHTPSVGGKSPAIWCGGNSGESCEFAKRSNFLSYFTSKNMRFMRSMGRMVQEYANINYALVCLRIKVWPGPPKSDLSNLPMAWWNCDGDVSKKWMESYDFLRSVVSQMFTPILLLVPPESHGYSTLFSFLKWPHVGISSVLRQTTFSHEETKSVGINPYKSSISGSVKSPYSSRLWMIMVDHIFIHPFNYPVSVLSISIDLVNHHI